MALGTSVTSLDDREAPRRAAAAVSLHGLGDEAWLLDRCGQRLFHLNPMAAFIWSAHLAGVAGSEIGFMLSGQYGVPPGAAADYVAQALQPWPEQDGQDPVPDDRDDPPLVLMAEPRCVEAYRALDAEIRLGFATRDLHARIHPSLSSLSVAGTSRAPRIWQIGALRGGFALVERGRVIDRCQRADQVAPMVKIRLVYAALERSRDACALHAAALGAGGRCLLLPGSSGAGKSTLAAGLASAGFTLLGDDTAVVTDGEPRVRPLPLPIALKAGSWTVLRDRVAGLFDLPIHWRPDGKAVRYVVPPPAARPALAQPALPVGWIVFPAFAVGRPAALEALSGGAALKRLIAGLAPLGSGLTPAKLDRLIGWIGGVACFELRYGALDDAVGLLKDFCR